MAPNIFPAISSSVSVTSLIGTSPVRFFPFGDAPQNSQLPYVVWQTVSGSPENFLGDLPDLDSYTIQVDVYAANAQSARDVAEAIRDAIEPIAHVVGWNGESRDPDTRNYRYSFDVAIFTKR